MRRLLIADPSVKDEAYVVSKLEKCLEVAFCRDGRDFYKMMQLFDPDILLMDLNLPHIDGLTAIRDIRSAGNMIPIIATAACLQDFLLAHLCTLNVCTVIKKPWKLDVMLDNICQMVEVPISEEFLQAELDHMLVHMGFKVGNTRYRYVTIAIMERYAMSDCSMTKELYPKVKLLVSGGKGSPEKAIRDAIGCARNAGDHDIWLTFFPALKPGKCPTNEEFITRIAMALHHRERPRKNLSALQIEAAGY